jgi:hypothetical protein
MKNKKHKAILMVLLCVLLFPVAAAAQSAASLDAVLDEEVLSFGASSYLVLAAVGEIPDETAFSQAASLLKERIPFFSERTAAEEVTLGEFAYMLMELTGPSGGLMYTLFPGPRYAARELTFQKAIQGSSFPNSSLSGEEALRILERFLFLTGGDV